MKQSRLLLLLPVVWIACKQSDPGAEAAGAFFPVRSFLQSQVKHIDTSLYPLRKVVKAGNASDTVFIPREQFRAEAAAFLAAEDLAGKEWKDAYTESRMYDDVLQRAIFSYTPKEADAPILRQDVTIQPGTAGGEDQVKTVFLHRITEAGDSTVQQKMLWEVDRRFQLITTVSRKGQPDRTRTEEVWWGDFRSAE